VLSGADMVSESGTDSSRQVLRQRALAILQQTIEDANSGKRQFLSGMCPEFVLLRIISCLFLRRKISPLIFLMQHMDDAGKLHNLVKALADEDSDDWSTGHGERRPLLGPEHCIGVGLGFRAFSRQSSKHAPLSASSGSGDITGEMALSVASKGTVKRFLGSLSNKPMAYLSAFILYIATVGDIVDGVDTTHDFNFFKLIYERPSDVRISCPLVRLLILHQCFPYFWVVLVMLLETGSLLFWDNYSWAEVLCHENCKTILHFFTWPWSLESASACLFFLFCCVWSSLYLCFPSRY
jgi:zinc finger FYVE domain-containing protein 26